MNSTIDAIVGILMIALAGTAIGPLYRLVERETLTHVYWSLHHSERLGTFTQKLTHARPRH